MTIREYLQTNKRTRWAFPGYGCATFTATELLKDSQFSSILNSTIGQDYKFDGKSFQSPSNMTQDGTLAFKVRY